MPDAEWEHRVTWGHAFTPYLYTPEQASKAIYPKVGIALAAKTPYLCIELSRILDCYVLVRNRGYARCAAPFLLLVSGKR